MTEREPGLWRPNLEIGVVEVMQGEESIERGRVLETDERREREREGGRENDYLIGNVQRDGFISWNISGHESISFNLAFVEQLSQIQREKETLASTIERRGAIQ